MKQWLLAIVLAVLCPLVAAQETMTDCGPRAGVNLREGLNASAGGGWRSYWCLYQGHYYVKIRALPAATILAVQDDYVKNVLNAPDYPAAMASFLSRNPAAAVSYLDPAIKPIWAPYQATIDASRPADPIVPEPPAVQKGWFIATNGTAKTRQWYACTGCTDSGGRLGTRSTSGGGSITIGTTRCDETKAFKLEMNATGDITYPYMAYGPTFNPARVTLCELRPL